MISSNVRVGDQSYQSNVDLSKLEEILGSQPKVSCIDHIGEMSFENGKMVVVTGSFVDITHAERTYTISPTQFSKAVGSLEIKGDGLFEGPWDENGKKLAHFFFSNHKEGSIIYLNDQQRRLLKKEDAIEFAE